MGALPISYGKLVINATSAQPLVYTLPKGSLLEVLNNVFPFWSYNSTFWIEFLNTALREKNSLCKQSLKTNSKENVCVCVKWALRHLHLHLRLAPHENEIVSLPTGYSLHLLTCLAVKEESRKLKGCWKIVGQLLRIAFQLLIKTQME